MFNKAAFQSLRWIFMTSAPFFLPDGSLEVSSGVAQVKLEPSPAVIRLE